MSLDFHLDLLSSKNLTIKEKKQALVDLVLRHFSNKQREELFLSVTNFRKKQLVTLFPEYRLRSLSTLFELIDYHDFIKKYPSSFPENIRNLEYQASCYYSHWLDFWCQCEIEAIKKNSPTFNKINSGDKLSFEDNDYTCMLVDKVEDSGLIVKMPGHANVMSLKDAITLSNLEQFIQDEKWYEMLPLLSLSQQGKHFILYKNNPTEPYPTLVASALVQDWVNQASWLSYTPQFTNNKWKFCLPKQAYYEFSRHQLFDTPAFPSCYSLSEFDHHFKLALSKPEQVCEVLRLAVNGSTQQKLYFLYLAQKKLMSLMQQKGYKFGFTVIEQVFMLNYYQSIGENAYFHAGYCDINDDHKITYRGFWNFEKMAEALNNTKFREYKRAVFSQKQLCSLNE
ncbi:acyl-homoserine-lactone synthase [Vibrio coralliilyticus]|uniref:acyl-homoserine-lactone synthase n=1 Tax=Vibrio TaxID=662 RepID=UPI0009C208C2|nr:MULTISPECIES: acyl-homoserine-lactone synthase [Vibrio]ARC94271.1 acyl-homoserine-lactone synthase [Vibrio coralliilyticus]NOI74561.1 acyl-homoserine-lactone synthase [Vibrio coralliilyticus]NUW69259.1 acyl-homoserine-lactone synthase [Vibrio coralliilyticus]PAW05153.1 acyl-homoserine-lactone synthase [Vibrio coralliilyticus]